MLPSATPDELADAIAECLEAGAHIVNLSLTIARPALRPEARLAEVLDAAAHRGTVVVAAAGNRAAVGGCGHTGHRWVVPVVACNVLGAPLRGSTLSASAGRHGVAAPGMVTSLSLDGTRATREGSSFAAALVTGTLGLLMSTVPTASAAAARAAVLSSGQRPRRAVMPPLLDALAAHRTLAATMERRR